MQGWLTTIAIQHNYLVYLLIVVLACLEGPFLSLFTGFLLYLGFFFFIPLYAALMIGDLIGDIGWYYVGRNYGHYFVTRYGKYFSVTEESISKITEIFHKHKYSILLISKLTNGFGFALTTLVTAGMVKIPFGKYLTVNVVGQFVWTGVLIGIGYSFSSIYIRVGNILARMVVVAFGILIAVAFWRYKTYLQNKARKLDIL